MKRILKYPLAIVDEPQHIVAPLGIPVFVADQSGNLTLWMEVDFETEPRDHTFVVHGTGHLIGADEHHIGSVIMEPFVWHIYRIGYPRADYPL